MSRTKRQGFANPEYLLTLAALLIVISIVIPKVARLRERRRNMKALFDLRGALARYGEDTKTKGPGDLAELTAGGKYLAEIPRVGVIGAHGASAAVRPSAVPDDAGGWSYDNWPGSPTQGTVRINCTHTDDRGYSWSSY